MSRLRKLRTGLKLLIVVLLTLLGHHFYQSWRTQQLAREIVEVCGLPELSPGLEILRASRAGNDVSLTVTGPDQEFVEWLGRLDQWEKSRPPKVLNFSTRESEGTPRLDFSAELRPPPRSFPSLDPPPTLP